MDIVITIIVTTLITFLISWPMAQRLSRENKLILESLEQGGLVKYTRDSNGKIQGRIVTAAAEFKSESSFTASSE